MDIGTARTFLEIVKCGSFVGAADNLHLTQTAVSARIRVLEDQLGQRLFIRNKSGAQMTPAGEQFFRFAASLVQIWDRARQSMALAPGQSTVALVGVDQSQWSPLMRHWLLWMREQCPDTVSAADCGILGGLEAAAADPSAAQPSGRLGHVHGSPPVGEARTGGRGTGR